MEQAGQREDGAAAVEVDGVVGREQLDRARGDPLLLGGGRAGLHVEVRLVEALVDRDGAAVDPPEPAGRGERVEVAADGGLGDAEGRAQLLEADRAARFDEGDEALATAGGEVVAGGRSLDLLHELLLHAQTLA